MKTFTYNLTRITLITILSLVISVAKAGDTAKARFLSIDSAVTMGLSHSHQLAISGSQLKQVQSSVADVKNRALPSVLVSASYTRLSNIPVQYFSFPGFPGEIPSTALFPIILNDYAATASLQESVFNGFLLKYATLNLEYTEKSAEYSYANDQKNISLNVITTYLSLFKVQQAEILIKESLEQIQSHVKEVSDFAAHGLATQNDVLRVKLDESNAELSEIDIHNQLLTINYDLDIMLGLPENTMIQVDSAMVLQDKTIQPLPYYMQQALSRDDIKAADLQQKAAEAGIKETQSDLYPKLSIAADYDYLRPNPRIVPPLDQFQPSWDVGFRISYNLTDLYSNKNKTDVSRAKLAEAQAEFADLSDNAKIEINQAYLQYQQAIQKTQVAQTSLEQAQENYRIVKSRYDNHIALLTDLMDANNYLLNAQISLISSKADAQLAYYKLLKSAGELNSKK